MARILIVEDDSMNCKLFDTILSRVGHHEVIVAVNAEDAVSKAFDSGIDLIIMDVSLQNWVYKSSEVNGIDLTKIIKSSEKSRNIPVLLVTAYAMQKDKEDLIYKSGADDYFSKPVDDYSFFLSKINELLKLNNPVIKGV